jgi:hypothetical protein
LITRALAMALALSASAAAAQDTAAGGERSRAREEVYRVIDDYVGRSLQERVGLTDEQAARALPLVRNLHADRRKFAKRRIRAFAQMRRAQRANAVTEARAAELVQELKTAESEEIAAMRAAHDAVDAVLTPVQQVKYRIFEGEIEHKLRELMAQLRAQRREQGGGRRGNRSRGASPAP